MSFEFWKARVAGTPLADGEVWSELPQSGRWRTKGAKARPSIPFAVWIKDQDLFIKVHTNASFSVALTPSLDALLRGGSEQYYNFQSKIWMRAEAVTADQYDQAIKTGEWWDGRAATAVTSIAAVPATSPPASERLAASEAPSGDDSRSKIGGNSGDPTGGFDKDSYKAKSPAFLALEKEINDLHAKIKADPAFRLADEDWTQDDLDRIANFATRMTALETKAKNDHDFEKDPINEAGRLISAKYQPMRNMAETDKKVTKGKRDIVLKAWKLKGERELREKQAAGAAITKADIEATRPKAGTEGRKAGVRSKKEFKVTDQDAMMKFILARPATALDLDIIQRCKKIASRLVSAGETVPGCHEE